MKRKKKKTYCHEPSFGPFLCAFQAQVCLHGVLLLLVLQSVVVVVPVGIVYL